MSEHILNAESFLRIYKEFQLGQLPTEGFHPLSLDLSELAKNNLSEALNVLKKIDIQALNILDKKLNDIYHLSSEIHKAFDSGQKVFLCGCGATGRLSLALETLFRQKGLGEQVISFMAGGDTALIKSIESFEDKVSYGARQLLELGFREGDLMIGITEGGETPFVIGATEEALKHSEKNPFFIYCNPADILCKVAVRSKKIIENKRIQSLELQTGPMALSGSTRMQASTVQMFAVGLALLYRFESFSLFEERFQLIKNILLETNYSFLESFIELESSIYQKQERLLYQTDSHLGITILTDTTERSPTFSLPSFENEEDEKVATSLCYLTLQDCHHSKEAWEKMLSRPPRALEWAEFEGRIGQRRLLGFDISSEAHRKRAQRGVPKQHRFIINQEQGILCFQLLDKKYQMKLESDDNFIIHLQLKLLLNSLSTLIMGRLGRFESNMMTWVRPSNYKLIDRAARYIEKLLKNKGIMLAYEEIIHLIFDEQKHLSDKDSIVMNVFQKVCKEFKD